MYIRLTFFIVLALLNGNPNPSFGLGFSDITSQAGVGGPAGNDAGGHGAMWADISGNGLPDVYMPFNWVTQQYPDYLYINLDGTRFSEEGVSRGVVDYDGGSHGACFADLDNDGDYDLINGTTLPNGSDSNNNNVYRNDGNGFFSDVTDSDIAGRGEETRAIVAFDMDSDGDLDIFAVSGWRGSGDPLDEKNEVYENRGDFSFVSHTSGPLYTCPAGQGAVDTDWDGDGDIDIIASNRDGNLNMLRNNGGINNFTLVEPSSIGINHTAYSGCTTGDIDNDGDLDLLIASDGNAWLYLSDGDGTFIYNRVFTGTDGYMGGFADLDNDGDLDLVFAGDGNVYLNDGSGSFASGPVVPGASDLQDPRAVAFADIDNDGDLDFMYAGKRSPNKLYRNTHNNDNWIKMELVAPNGQAGGFGAKVRVYPADGTTLLGLREAKSNYGYLGQDDPVLHFGLGDISTIDIFVEFPDGKTIAQESVTANRTVTIDASAVKYGELDKSGTLYAPFLEWGLDNPSYSGNPFDLIASATFAHSSSGESHTTQMFYDGQATWKFRFTPTRTGIWTVTTSSADAELDSRSGTVVVTPNANSNTHGFMKQFGDKWGWQGTQTAYAPQYAMVGDNGASQPGDFDTISEVNGLIAEYMTGHGFTGFHIAVIGGRWFDKTKATNAIDSSLTDPDPATFEALELLITKTHLAGGSVHIWPWGDSSRGQTPRQLPGGINGEVDQRLQRYISARLGPVPGWSMGYGFDLDEWVNESQLHSWHDRMHAWMGWHHFLGGRHKNPNSGTDHSSTISWNTGMDYNAYEHHKPSYDVLVAAMSTNPDQPVFSEDRFRMRNSGRTKDYNEEETRRGLWYAYMAGGVAGIWGNLLTGDIAPYPNKDQLKTNSIFFNDNNRFTPDMVRDNPVMDTMCLKRPTNRHYIFYKENTGEVQMDLSAMSGMQQGVAVDARLSYAEITIGPFSPGSHTWTAPYVSDWAIAVGDFEGGTPSNIPPTVDAGSDASITLPTRSVNLDGTVSDPDNTPSTTWSMHSGPAEVSFGNVSDVDTIATFSVAGTYVLQLSADDGNNPVVSDTVTITVNAEPTQAPSNLVATTVSDSRIDLHWIDNASNETGFAIERAKGSGGPVTVTIVSYNSTNTAPTIENAGSTNSFRAGGAQVSDRSTTWTSVPPELDGATRMLCARNDKADAGYNTMYTVDLDSNATVYAIVSPEYGTSPMEFMDNSWSLTTMKAGYSQNSDLFSIWKKEASAGDLVLGADDDGSKQGACYVFVSGSSWMQIGTTAANTTSYNDTGLQMGTEYSYRVKATSLSEDSAWSNTASATTDGDVPPDDCSADIDGDGTIDLSDSVIGLQVLVGTNPAIEAEKACENNGNEVVGLADIIYGLKFLAGTLVE